MHPLYLLDAGRQALTLLPIMSLVRTRFAPSPTGYLHIGGARTALFNWLFARKMGGTFILRIEDTEEATRAIFTGMEWLGLDWDEGPMKGGDCGPYFQSQRNDIYDAYFKKLQDAGRVYEDEGAWRFRFDRSKPVTFHDLICGNITIDYRDASNTPDMAIRRADGSYIFHFVNVVDDIEMKMTHVIRGEDHIMNTPKHNFFPSGADRTLLSGSREPLRRQIRYHQMPLGQPAAHHRPACGRIRPPGTPLLFESRPAGFPDSGCRHRHRANKGADPGGSPG